MFYFDEYSLYRCLNRKRFELKIISKSIIILERNENFHLERNKIDEIIGRDFMMNNIV